jgi:hypothetical protein
MKGIIPVSFFMRSAPGFVVFLPDAGRSPGNTFPTSACREFRESWFQKWQNANILQDL